MLLRNKQPFQNEYLTSGDINTSKFGPCPSSAPRAPSTPRHNRRTPWPTEQRTTPNEDRILELNGLRRLRHRNGRSHESLRQPLETPRGPGRLSNLAPSSARNHVRL